MNNNIEKLSKLTDEKYQELFCVKKATFDNMLSILQVQCKKRRKTVTGTVDFGQAGDYVAVL